MFVQPIIIHGRRSTADCPKTIRSELGNVETLGISKPGPAALLAYDLDIWVSQAKGPTLNPILGEGATNRSWASPHEELLFQRYFGKHLYSGQS